MTSKCENADLLAAARTLADAKTPSLDHFTERLPKREDGLAETIRMFTPHFTEYGPADPLTLVLFWWAVLFCHLPLVLLGDESTTGWRQLKDFLPAWVRQAWEDV